MQIQQQIPWESVGKGSFGEVYANDAAPEKVIKLFTSSTHKNVNKNIIKREQAMCGIHNDYIVKTYSCISIQNTHGILLERCDEDLFSLLQRKEHLCDNELVSFISQLCLGVYFLHQQGIQHNDIKLENVLVKHDNDGQMQLKLCDFGLAHSDTWIENGECYGSLVKSPDGSYLFFGSSAYLPSYEDAIGRLVFLRDEWALGCTIIAMTYGHMLYLKYETVEEKIFDVGEGKSYDSFGEFFSKPPRISEPIIQCFLRYTPMSIQEACNTFNLI